MKAFKRSIDELTLVPRGGGRFELTVDGELVYSKLQTGSFPDEAEIEDEVRQRL